MDIAHKEYLEKKSHDELVQTVMDRDDIIDYREKELQEARLLLNEKQLMIDTLLKIVKYQNGLND